MRLEIFLVYLFGGKLLLHQASSDFASICSARQSTRIDFYDIEGIEEKYRFPKSKFLCDENNVFETIGDGLVLYDFEDLFEGA